MKELLNKNQIEQELKTYHLDINIINKAKEVFTRWNTSVDLTKEKPNQIPFLTEFFGEILGYQSIAGKKILQFPFEQYPQGTYFIQLLSEKKNITQKIIKP